LLGDIVGYIIIHLDITALKNLELQKELILKELEISNNQLHEYAHIVSHDLKSPLRSIDALVSWIKADNVGKFDKITTQNFQLLDTTLETMEKLISNVLKYSSAGSKAKEKEKDIDLNSTVSNLKNMLLIPANISIKVLNKLPTVRGDKTKFQQLFQNLLSNAIKFCDKENGIIEINYVDNNTFHQFSIKDNGIGIPKKYHDKIFQIFHSLNKRKDSTGVGLSIVKKIINLHEGDIWLESEPNVGTTFYFTIKKNK
jgi:light-regulated signal transduction histidine kinase (bacteriophytochrome)